MYPVLLHLLERRAAGTATSSSIAESMLYLESFFVRRVVIGRATANINRILLRATAEIRGKDDVAGALREYLSTGRKFYATDTEVRLAVQTAPFYWSGRRAQQNLVLQWLEESHGSKEPTSAALSIEHVMPQTLSSGWRESLAASIEPGQDLDAVHQSIVHTLGNLTLTGYNAELSNSPFEVKKEKLASSALAMNQRIAVHTTWGPEQISARCSALAEMVIELWPGPTATAASSTGGDDSPLWTTLARLLAELPAGRWTTYGDVAAVIGTHPVPLGQRLANHPAPNAHRILSADGRVAENFRWTFPERDDDPHEVLVSEGISFDDQGRASTSQRLVSSDLAALLGVDSTEPDADD